MKKKLYFGVLSILCFIYVQGYGQTYKTSVEQLGIVPLPREIAIGTGSYTLPGNIIIYAKSQDERNVAEFLTAYIHQLGYKVSVSDNSNEASIHFNTKGKSSGNPEAYQLVVNEDGVEITASAGPGLFYGMQTFVQLLPVTPLKDKTISIPFVEIQDEPAFEWRGSMLDVCRHFFPVSFIKKYIDFLAAYKINTFHWHLTDDQGWRIEIKKYPKLTEISAFRKETLIGAQQMMKNPEDFKYDGTRYGGYYTQEQIKDIIAYAQKRYITIVPEIEMPGHTSAVLAAYPELACKPGDYEVATKWGVFEDIVCPTEETFVFFENVLEEVVALFPGKYIHIGGDEAPKDRWRESARVKKIMKREGIEEVEMVQGWFNQRIEKFLNSKGKKLVGWDEILEGGITPNATVMSWRGIEGGIEAAKHGNDVVMSPTTHMYLDYGQNPEPHAFLEPLMICCYLPIEKVYGFNPLPEALTKREQQHILGVQANLWTEYITTPNKVEYMLFPRLMAMSEVAWTPIEKRDFESFQRRISKQFPRLSVKDIHYRVPEPVISQKEDKQGEKATIDLKSIVPGAEIRYTLDGEVPNETTHLYTASFAVPRNQNITVKAVAITPDGRHSVPVKLVIP